MKCIENNAHEKVRPVLAPGRTGGASGEEEKPRYGSALRGVCSIDLAGTVLLLGGQAGGGPPPQPKSMEKPQTGSPRSSVIIRKERRMCASGHLAMGWGWGGSGANFTACEVRTLGNPRMKLGLPYQGPQTGLSKQESIPSGSGARARNPGSGLLAAPRGSRRSGGRAGTSLLSQTCGPGREDGQVLLCPLNHLGGIPPPLLGRGRSPARTGGGTARSPSLLPPPTRRRGSATKPESPLFPLWGMAASTVSEGSWEGGH